MISSFIELSILRPDTNNKALKGDKIKVRSEHIILFSPGTPYEFIDSEGNEVGTTIELSSGQTYYAYEDYYEVHRKVLYSHLSEKELEEAQKKCEHEWGPTETNIVEATPGPCGYDPRPKELPKLVQIMSRTCKKCGLEERQSSPYYGYLESEE